MEEVQNTITDEAYIDKKRGKKMLKRIEAIELDLAIIKLKLEIDEIEQEVKSNTSYYGGIEGRVYWGDGSAAEAREKSLPEKRELLKTLKERKE